MIIISSIRPHMMSEAYRTNQIRAKQSWERVCEKIVYFSAKEPELDSPKTVWVESDQWPKIQTMARYASNYKGISAIVNADIVLNDRIINVERVLEHSGLVGITSRRYELDTGELNPNDKGRDIFMLKRHAWQRVSELVPPSCRIGHNEWDAWMIGFLRKVYKRKFGEFTRCKCVFHPNHGERYQPYVNEVDISGPFKGYWDGKLDTQIIIDETPRVAG